VATSFARESGWFAWDSLRLPVLLLTNTGRTRFAYLLLLACPLFHMLSHGRHHGSVQRGGHDHATCRRRGSPCAGNSAYGPGHGRDQFGRVHLIRAKHASTDLGLALFRPSPRSWWRCSRRCGFR
jgi:hypothetical protein